ncbi:malate:quinone oxidoreductase [Nocardioides lianchengensis]|uniref:malate:quinone oxidoreductase n=1 Tax=Nocardioides lianchengensis TaxID=1045774 RepID=UPI0017FEDC03|nr:malate:quinone oxidoreductase [Nocardioides lianchengensis]NYG10317.1 malate dehydrogenase (quinone) [Nocardioides lianchengensis]
MRDTDQETSVSRPDSETTFQYDALLVGGGIMSATLATLLHQVEPSWSIAIVERLDELALESSGPWNNAGTGHAALCELNYSPELPDGTVDVSKAIGVNEQFQLSRQLWAFLVESGRIPDPTSFIHPSPHLSFVWGDENVAYLRKRYDALAAHPLFAGMEYTEDPAVVEEWAPLLMAGRDRDQPVAATRSLSGTDVDFGSLTRQLVAGLADRLTTEVVTGIEVKRLDRIEGGWRVRGKRLDGAERYESTARFVFVGAGGQALTLLQRSGIPEIRGFAGFPVSGEFWRTTDPAIVARHQAKVYGRAAVGAPPMSVPHLDTRMVDGTPSLMFGPYAGFSPRFLKNGSLLDLFRSIRLHNLWPMLQVGFRNLSLVVYLVGQLLAGKQAQLNELRQFFPDAEADDWEKIVAGQRVQVIKRVPGQGGVLQFGTELIAASDGSIAGLLGASPGASTAVPIMLDVLAECFPDKVEDWRPALEKMIPSYGVRLSDDPELAADVLRDTAQTLGLSAA